MRVSQILTRMVKSSRAVPAKVLQKRPIVHYTKLKDTSPFLEMKSLAPVNGVALNFTQLIEQLYSKAKMDPTAALPSLVKAIFHRDGEHFSQTKHKSLAAYYLSPQLIAKVLYYANTDQLTAPKVREELYIEWEKLYSPGKKLSKAMKDKIDDLLNKIIAAKKESSAMTDAVMLAFLNYKSDSREEVIEYLAELEKLNPSMLAGKEKKSAGSDRLFSLNKILDDINGKSPEEILKVIDLNYENLILDILSMKTKLSKVIVADYSHGGKKARPDCMEVALRNLYNKLIFDEKSKCFNFEILPKLLQKTMHKNLRAYYQLQDFNKDKINEKSIGQYFFDMVAENHLFTYGSGDYELGLTADNVLAVTNYLFGCAASSFDKLSELFSDDRRQVIFKKVENDVVISIRQNGMEVDNLTLKFRKDGRHAELKSDSFVDSSSKINFLPDDMFCAALPTIINQYPMVVNILDKYSRDRIFEGYLEYYRCQPHARDLNVIKFLLSIRCDINKINESGYTPLYYLVNDPNALDFLIKLGINPSFLDNNCAIPSLHTVNNASSARILIAAGVDPNFANALMYTPLHFRCSNLEIVKVLLLAGANPHAMSLSGEKPIDLAIKQRDKLPQGNAQIDEYNQIISILEKAMEESAEPSLSSAPRM